MAARPTLPQDRDKYPGLQGVSMPLPMDGLSALDQEREGSMADEGGTSGMAMESEDPAAVHQGYSSHTRWDTVPERLPVAPPVRSRRARWPYMAAGVLALGVAGAVALAAARRRD